MILSPYYFPLFSNFCNIISNKLTKGYKKINEKIQSETTFEWFVNHNVHFSNTHYDILFLSCFWENKFGRVSTLSPDEMYLGSFIGRVALRRQQYLFSIAQVFVLTTHNHKVNIKQRIIEDRILTTKTYQTTYGGISV